MNADQIKANGVHLTPPDLAKFLAEVLIDRLVDGQESIEILDPACGEGALLFAFAQCVPASLRKRVSLFGYEMDGDALRQTAKLLANAGVANVVLEQRDFLTLEGVDVSPRCGQLSLLDDFGTASLRQFDGIIANPPYVRTQVLGAAVAQDLAKRFGLSGRVDLYHAFTKAMANVLKPGGVLGLLTSNRFLTVKSGASLRHLLRTEFNLEAIYDLGDTKLFSAAVLPVIVIARKQRTSDRGCLFDRVYEFRANGQTIAPDHECAGVLDAFRERQVKGLVCTDKGIFKIERGMLLATDDEVWSLSTDDYQEWLDRVESQRVHWFDDVVNIRVGIKTTADEVFIRDDWETLPSELQPEAELLRPLITHVQTQRWLATPPIRRVLYTHTVERGKRVAINLEGYPKAKAYLEANKERLASRKYVIEAGRQWYEIWVPQSPDEWRRQKIASPDIAEEPRFCFDSSGAIVNGDCYWMTLRQGFESEWLMLILAIANSSFVTRYYDISFHNKLYAGRRRFMTQYIKKFPLPHAKTPVSQKIIRLARELVMSRTLDREREAEIDQLVWESFGLVKEACR